ncbi:MAG: hypothetical protein ACSHWQ_09945, partial [Spongiibacteraceae bacterium]
MSPQRPLLHRLTRKLAITLCVLATTPLSAQSFSPTTLVNLLPVSPNSTLNMVLVPLNSRGVVDGLIPIGLAGLRTSSLDDILLSTDLGTLQRGELAGLQYSAQAIGALLLKDLTNANGYANFLSMALQTGSAAIANNVA